MYIVLAFCGVGALVARYRMKWAPRDHTSAAGGGSFPERREGPEDLETTLARLGIGLNAAVTDPRTALLGGVAKASIFRGSQALDANRLDEAIQSFTSVIDLLGKDSSPGTTRTLAVAHYLRARANERKQLASPALEDYTRALQLWPEHREARAGVGRLGGSPGPQA